MFCGKRVYITGSFFSPAAEQVNFALIKSGFRKHGNWLIKNAWNVFNTGEIEWNNLVQDKIKSEQFTGGKWKEDAVASDRLRLMV